ncbi:MULTISPECIES: ABC transporter permease [unclassified Paracoccus (in: a-proteobacteria)]|uniref:ABC transporter permease n=1 Tax=unclassified Paracoccus (in: a-proteobacteria) TaxID=2688777 RepID=UPI001600FC87|nr:MULTISPECIES: ABC transporter permease [unclassified Paracoccus (in: a-proteobacteria)]MBB1492184.1 ABC transporter permease [Paracoccus sp. MC1854]MBB1498602.1 ABC transporter permease [Paracoccus sp. MC1862]QQO44144.1 ABC transporter permease [Paracoccus sp. MC1862]
MRSAALAAPPLALSRPGLLFAGLGLAGLALPFVQFRANRIVAGEGLGLPGALGPQGWIVAALLAAVLAGTIARTPPRLSLLPTLAGALAVIAAAGLAAKALVPEGDRLARVSLGAGFWLLLLAFALAIADALARLRPSLPLRWLLLAGTIAAGGLLLGSGLLDDLSVMREYDARREQFWREAGRHLTLAFGSLGAALAVGLPLGILIHEAPRGRDAVLGVLNVVQTIPSLALFGIMIPLFGWVAATVPGAAQAGISGIGAFPALVALFLYSLLPVVSNMVVGLAGVPVAVREAAVGLGMTRAQALAQVLIPLTLPVVLAAVRIVLVQNIGLAVIAGLIGGGGFGSFVFQGLNQTAMDLVLLGAIPTIALALVSGIALDLILAGLDPRKARA